MANSPDALTRRGFLASGASVLLPFVGAGCDPYGRSHVTVRMKFRGKSRRIGIEKRLRAGPLEVNESLTLRRYAGHRTPDIREGQLIRLARTASAEESFLHTRPDNVWTEIGVFTEFGDNAWKGYGIRNLPLRALLYLFSGRFPEIPRPVSVTNYHHHPIRFVKKAVRKAGLPARYEKLAFLPSAGDLFTHVRMRHAFFRYGIALDSKVAVPSGLIAYDVSPLVARAVLRNRHPLKVKALDAYDDACIHFTDADLKLAEFPKYLTGRMAYAGYGADAVRLTYAAAGPRR